LASQERCSKVFSGKNAGISAVFTEFGGSAAGAGTLPPADDLYDHIIFLDGARGECYGRTKSERLPNQ
jgi:hypothetical protein